MRRRGTALVSRPTTAPRTLVAVIAAVAVATVLPATAVAAAQQRASFTQIENDVMCVACHESLAVAQSPEAYSERQYIRTLIAQGQTRKQIEHNLVQQYGPSVLALPPAHGFNLLVYVVPPLILALGIVTVAITLPRWRRRTRLVGAAESEPVAALDPADAHRLDEDLGRYA
jgi:cytochrome c-type biogenesis protein CcmH